MKNNIIIGITGGIGSGKSTVSKYLTSLGEKVICADAVSKQIVQPGQMGSLAIRREFGDEFFLSDNSLDRQKLAREVFSDKNKLARLNSILHPIIVNHMFDIANNSKGRVFLDAALLIQTKMDKKTDFVWLVIADRKIRISRVLKRNKFSYSEIKKRIDNQMTDEDMISFADEIIENNGDLSSLYSKTDMLLKKREYLR